MTRNPFCYFKTSREVIQLALMMYVRFPLSLRNVEDLLHERGIDVCHESIRLWVDRFGPLFANQIRSRRSAGLRQTSENLGTRIVLIDGERLAKLMIKYGVGCTTETVLYLKKIDESFFDEV